MTDQIEALKMEDETPEVPSEEETPSEEPKTEEEPSAE